MSADCCCCHCQVSKQRRGARAREQRESHQEISRCPGRAKRYGRYAHFYLFLLSAISNQQLCQGGTSLQELIQTELILNCFKPLKVILKQSLTNHIQFTTSSPQCNLHILILQKLQVSFTQIQFHNLTIWRRMNHLRYTHGP